MNLCAESNTNFRHEDIHVAFSNGGKYVDLNYLLTSCEFLLKYFKAYQLRALSINKAPHDGLVSSLGKVDNSSF